MSWIGSNVAWRKNYKESLQVSLSVQIFSTSHHYQAPQTIHQSPIPTFTCNKKQSYQLSKCVSPSLLSPLPSWPLLPHFLTPLRRSEPVCSPFTRGSTSDMHLACPIKDSLIANRNFQNSPLAVTKTRTINAPSSARDSNHQACRLGPRFASSPAKLSLAVKSLRVIAVA